jgi:cupin 2 domain-containing protein
MSAQPGNFFESLPDNLEQELVERLLASKHMRIERIISTGQQTPHGDWYDQDNHEWVMLLQGAATLEFENADVINLKPGDYVNVPAHCKHRVVWTDPDSISIWLAIHYSL